MKLVAGLGNPGIQYQNHRHNIGFQVIDCIAQSHHIPLSIKKFHALYGLGQIKSQKVILLKPMTFMNRSGMAIREVIDFFELTPEDLIVIHDDMDLPFGRLRFKQKGGDGGHQGVRSIIDSLGKNNFIRLKVGIGRPPNGMEPADYVLSPFNEEEKPHLEEILSQASQALIVMLSEGIERAMNQFQKRRKRKDDSLRKGKESDIHL